MMFSRSLGGSTELVEIIEFDGPTHDAKWMLPGCHAAYPECQRGLAARSLLGSPHKSARFHIPAVVAEDERRDRPHRHRLREP